MSTYLNRVENNLRAANISILMFCTVANVKQPTLSACMSGRLMMSGVEELRLYELSARCFDVAEAIKPLVFEKGNGLALKALVESSLSVEEIRATVGRLFNSSGSDIAI